MEENQTHGELSDRSDVSNSNFDDDKKFFVANMSFSITPLEVKEWFTSQFGPVQSVKIIYDKRGNSKGYGFVYMETNEGTQAVEDFTKKSGYRVEMYGRKNVQLHKHMNDRSIMDTRISSTANFNRPHRDANVPSSTNHYRTLLPHGRNAYSIASPLNPTDAIESSTLTPFHDQAHFFETVNPSSMVYPQYRIGSSRPYSSNQQYMQVSFSGNMHTIDPDMYYYTHATSHDPTMLPPPITYYVPTYPQMYTPGYTVPLIVNQTNEHSDELSQGPSMDSFREIQQDKSCT